jgi:hypothetical protein
LYLTLNLAALRLSSMKGVGLIGRNGFHREGPHAFSVAGRGFISWFRKKKIARPTSYADKLLTHLIPTSQTFARVYPQHRQATAPKANMQAAEMRTRLAGMTQKVRMACITKSIEEGDEAIVFVHLSA